MGIKGFPTLKIVRPGKKTGKPVVDDYQGPRTATGIVEAVVDKMNNHVKRVTDKDMAEFLGQRNESAKAVLFTEKGSTSALLKGIAIDFLDVIEVAQVRSKEAESVGMFGVSRFPTLILLPGGDKEGIVYEGEMKKAAIVEFLSQAGAPNPGAAAKPEKKKEPKKEAKKEAEEKPAEEAPEPEPEKVVPQAPPIMSLMTPEQLATECLHPKAGTCVLALVPEEKHEGADALLVDLAEVVHRNAVADRPLFPIYAVPAANPAYAALKGGLGVEGEVEVVAVNAKRGWWRRFEGTVVGEWIDGVKMGEGEKRKLPEGIVVEAEGEKKVETETEKETVAEAEESKTAEDTHDEL